MRFNLRGNTLRPAPSLWKAGHQVLERASRGAWRRLLPHCAKFRHHLVMNRDLDADARVLLHFADKCRQMLSCFTDREFHPDLHVGMAEMYIPVQSLSMQESRAEKKKTFSPSHR
jgi:hypothetical protein